MPPVPAESSSLFGFCDGNPDRYTMALDLQGRSTLDTSDVTSTITWRPGPVTLTAISAYKYLDVNGLSDVDATPSPSSTPSIMRQRARLSARNCASPRPNDGPMPFGGHFDWLIGTYFFRQKYEASQSLAIFGGTPLDNNQRTATGCCAISAARAVFDQSGS